MSKKGRLFADNASTLMREQNVPLGIEGGLSLTVIMYPPDKRKRDLDNHMKATQDAITKHGVWLDDDQINQLYVYRGEVVKKGKIVIMISDEGMIIPDGMEQIAFGE